MLVGEKEQCKVTDFGLARDVQEEGFYEKKTKVSDSFFNPILHGLFWAGWSRGGWNPPHLYNFSPIRRI